jgi:hypothetical protein
MPTIDQIEALSSFLGYCGTAAVVISYFLNQRGLLASTDWRYPAINLLGSVLLAISLCFHMNLPSILIEIFWFSISLYGLHRNLRAGSAVQ